MKEMEQLYRRHKDELYRYLLALTGDREAAGDLLQETFLQAMLGIGRFRGESSVRTWLFAIARNLWLKSLRKKLRKKKKLLLRNRLLSKNLFCVTAK